MGKSIQLFIWILLLGFYNHIANTAEMKEQATAQPFATHALLIFLDDSESDKNPVDKFGAMSSDLVSALEQEAGPIMVSASLLANVGETKKPKETAPKKLLERFTYITNKDYEKRTKQERFERKRIVLSVAAFNQDRAKNWIIKEIDASLYLLLPKEFLRRKNITDVSANNFAPGGPITATEQALGLKVNHMKTISVADIKKPLPEPEFADYFIQALPNIFVMNNEYTQILKITAAEKAKKKVEELPFATYPTSAMPTWAIYIGGHGDINHAITNLSLEQFKEFMQFLATKIITKLLFYWSCYAAGVNNETMYGDAEKGVIKSYPFVIITQALTDAPVSIVFLDMQVDHDQLKLKLVDRYPQFISKLTTSQVINYQELVEPFIPNLKEFGLGNLPQIKFPGLPWMSVFDSDKVATIGSILAKTRTQPLNISTFFARKGKPAEPLAILLYAQDISFELIINTKTIPGIISMIAGDVTHHLAKIISANLTIDDILNGFLTVESLATHKTFMIDQISGLFSPTTAKLLNDKSGAIENVVIDLTEYENTIYFTYKGVVYTAIGKVTGDNPIKIAEAEQKEKYKTLLEASKKESKETQEYLAPENITQIRQAQQKKIATPKKD